jgi:hypothetical protein
MTDETAKTTTFQRMDSETHALVTALLDEVSARAASQAVEAQRESDVEATQQLTKESGEKMRLLKKEAKEEALDDAKKHARRIGIIVAAAVTAFAGAGGFGAWKLAGPERAVERAEKAAHEVEDTKADVERAVANAIEDERAKVRKETVDGRLGGLETRMGKLEGRQAGIETKVDALVEHQLGERRAGEVKAEAAKVAAKAESDSG